MKRVFDRLLSLQAEEADGANLKPSEHCFGPEAHKLWRRFYNEFNEEAELQIGDRAAAFSKLEGYTARFALVLHCLRWACGNKKAPPRRIEVSTLNSAIKLTRWFTREAQRIYDILDEDQSQAEQRRILEFIHQRPQGVTARELARASGRFSSTEEAERYLNELVRAGRGEWRNVDPGAKGGRPTRRFRLRDNSNRDEPPAEQGDT